MNQKLLSECKFMAKLFVDSLSLDCSSPVFIRRYMNSSMAKNLDDRFAMTSAINSEIIFDSLEEEYGEWGYGHKKYTADELYWIGFIYRYWSLEYHQSSKHIYNIVNAESMRKLYFSYHSLDSKMAVERILEARDLLHSDEEEAARQLNIFRSVMKKNS